MRRLITGLALTGFVICASGGAVRAQAPQASSDNSFEVASIKRNTSIDQLSSINAQPGGRITTLRNIVRNINRLQRYQLVGGPDWADQDRWDIVAKGEGDAPFDQLVAMMRSLLTDRFKLVTHRETRELPIYALVLAHQDGTFGPQFRVSTATDCTPEAEVARARAGTCLRLPMAGPTAALGSTPDA